MTALTACSHLLPQLSSTRKEIEPKLQSLHKKGDCASNPDWPEVGEKVHFAKGCCGVEGVPYKCDLSVSELGVVVVRVFK